MSFSIISRWQKAFRSAYPFLEQPGADPARLRLILGVGRSGTSWVSQTLFRTKQPVRCFSEPLYHISPKLPFHKKPDHTAAGCEAISAEHPLSRAYQLLTHREFRGPEIVPPARNDANWELCVVKEVHSLLGTDGLLKLWKTPSIFILRDPVYIADSLFAAQTLESAYLDHEVAAVRQPAFLERFAPGRQREVKACFADAEKLEARRRVILSKVVCMQLMQQMFSVLAAEFPFAKAIRYDDICAAPRQVFPELAEALSLPWDDAMAAYLAETMVADATLSDPYSVKRNTGEQKDRPFKFLTAEEAASCRAAIHGIKA